MNLFNKNKKRNKDEYLKFKNGNIISLGEKKEIPQDKDELNNNRKKINDSQIFSPINNINLENPLDTKKLDPKKDKKKIISTYLIKIGCILIIIPVLYMGYASFKGYKDNLNSTVNEQGANEVINNTTNSDNTDVTPDTNNTPIANDVNDNKLDINTTKKSNLTDLLNEVELINSNLYKSIEATKLDVVNYANSVNGINATTESLNARKNRVKKNIQIIEDMKDKFSALGLDDLHLVILKRYNNIDICIDRLILTLDRSTVIKTTNIYIENNNLYLNKQNTLIKEYLDSNNINYVEENGTYTIK